MLEAATRDAFPLIIVAEDVEQEAVVPLVVNKLCGLLRLVVCKVSSFCEHCSACIEGIAILLGVSVVIINPDKIVRSAFENSPFVARTLLASSVVVAKARYQEPAVSSMSKDDEFGYQTAQRKTPTTKQRMCLHGLHGSHMILSPKIFPSLFRPETGHYFPLPLRCDNRWCAVLGWNAGMWRHRSRAKVSRVNRACKCRPRSVQIAPHFSYFVRVHTYAYEQMYARTAVAVRVLWTVFARPFPELLSPRPLASFPRPLPPPPPALLPPLPPRGHTHPPGRPVPLPAPVPRLCGARRAARRTWLRRRCS